MDYLLSIDDLDYIKLSTAIPPYYYTYWLIRNYIYNAETVSENTIKHRPQLFPL
jgi:hypothetical protein